MTVTLPAVAAAAWSLTTMGMGAWATDLSPWYYALRNPSWKPPDWAFGPAWSLILILSGVGFYFGWEASTTWAEAATIIVAFLVNGALNIHWSLLFFRQRRPDWALIQVPFLWLSILSMILAVGQVSWLAPLLVLPYLLWVSFASCLNLAIVRRNRPFAGRTRG